MLLLLKFQIHGERQVTHAHVKNMGEDISILMNAIVVVVVVVASIGSSSGSSFVHGVDESENNDVNVAGFEENDKDDFRLFVVDGFVFERLTLTHSMAHTRSLPGKKNGSR